MTATLIGYTLCSTNDQDLTAQRAALTALSVAEDRVYTDHGLTGTNRARPGLDQAIAAVREGDTLVVPKLSHKQQRELTRMHATGDYSISDLAEVFSVSRPTVYRTLKRQET